MITDNWYWRKSSILKNHYHDTYYCQCYTNCKAYVHSKSFKISRHIVSMCFTVIEGTPSTVYVKMSALCCEFDEPYQAFCCHCLNFRQSQSDKSHLTQCNPTRHLYFKFANQYKSISVCDPDLSCPQGHLWWSWYIMVSILTG